MYTDDVLISETNQAFDGVRGNTYLHPAKSWTFDAIDIQYLIGRSRENYLQKRRLVKPQLDLTYF